jgi:carbonic anhydrase
VNRSKHKVKKDTSPALLVNATIAMIPILFGQLVYKFIIGSNILEYGNIVFAFLISNYLFYLAWQKTNPLQPIKNILLFLILTFEWTIIVSYSFGEFFNDVQKSFVYFAILVSLVLGVSQWFHLKSNHFKDISASLFALLGLASTSISGFTAFNNNQTSPKKTTDLKNESFLLLDVDNQTQQAGQMIKSERNHLWDYNVEFGPTKWASLNSKFELCNSGKYQSPIDIPSRAELSNIPISLNYATESATVSSSFAQSLELSFDGKSYLTAMSHRFHIQSISIHSPSEHTVSGFYYPIELQVFHISKTGQKLALSIFAEKGKENKAVESIISSLAIDKNNEHKTISLDVSKILPSKLNHWSYSGSITVPPCVEGVTWNVFQSTIELSERQITRLRAILQRNARPTQPLNDRLFKIIDKTPAH